VLILYVLQFIHVCLKDDAATYLKSIGMIS